MDGFDQLVKDAIRSLKNGRETYAFFQYQVDFIQKAVPNVKVKEDDGVYILRMK